MKPVADVPPRARRLLYKLRINVENDLLAIRDRMRYSLLTLRQERRQTTTGPPVKKDAAFAVKVLILTPVSTWRARG